MNFTRCDLWLRTSCSIMLSLQFIFASGCADSREPSTDSMTGGASTDSSDAPKGESEVALPERRYPKHVTDYDILTPEEELYFQQLDSLCQGPDLQDWPLVSDLVDLGQDLVNAPQWASIGTKTIYVSDQPRARPIKEMVDDCARILGVTPPAIHIEGDSTPIAYTAELTEPPVLVLTAGLLDLFEESPEELRFVIGHQLGHMKVRHHRPRFLARMLVDSIRGEPGDKASFAETFFATVAVNALLHWYRESQYSADRAGLLCVGGDVTTAQQALLRLLHQTKPSNKLFDPSQPDFDPDLILKNQVRILEEPFVKIVARMRERGSAEPFIPERCAALEAWAATADFEEVMNGSSDAYTGRNLVIKSVRINGLPAVDTYVPLVDSGDADPLLRLTYNRQLREAPHGIDLKDVEWKDWTATEPFGIVRGGRLIVEVFDYNAAFGESFIGACAIALRQSEPGSHTATSRLRLDLRERSSVIDLPKVTVEYEIR